jgi:hypothetical protein
MRHAHTEIEQHHSRQQRGLLALIKDRGDVPDDPYLQRAARSRELAMMRGIALWWRALAVQMQCPITTRLLKRLGCFDALVAAWFDASSYLSQRATKLEAYKTPRIKCVLLRRRHSLCPMFPLSQQRN